MAYESIINFLNSSEYQQKYTVLCNNNHIPTNNILVSPANRVSSATTSPSQLLSLVTHLNLIGGESALSQFLGELIEDEKSTAGSKTIACCWLARLKPNQAKDYLDAAKAYSENDNVTRDYCTNARRAIIRGIKIENKATNPQDNVSQYRMKR